MREFFSTPLATVTPGAVKAGLCNKLAAWDGLPSEGGNDLFAMAEKLAQQEFNPETWCAVAAKVGLIPYLMGDWFFVQQFGNHGLHQELVMLWLHRTPDGQQRLLDWLQQDANARGCAAFDGMMLHG